MAHKSKITSATCITCNTFLVATASYKWVETVIHLASECSCFAPHQSIWITLIHRHWPYAGCTQLCTTLWSISDRVFPVAVEHVSSKKLGTKGQFCTGPLI